MSNATQSGIAVIGPGRVGTALARRWHESGRVFAGFFGRDPKQVARAIEFVGAGNRLAIEDLAHAQYVCFAVRDNQLIRVASLCAEFAGPGQTWFHCSGSSDLSPLKPVAERGAAVGSLHPVCPFPDAATGYTNLAGSPGILQVDAADDTALETLASIATAAGLLPVPTSGGDRLVYHAACVLAANGLTALFSAVSDLLQSGLPNAEVGILPPALMRSALDSCQNLGATAALSGPVVRGDADLLARQLAAVDKESLDIGRIYRSLMTRACDLAQERGSLSPDAVQTMRGVLDLDG